MTTINVTGPLPLLGYHSTNEVVASSLPVDLSTSTWRTILRAVVPCAAGDLLDVDAWLKATNDIPDAYNVGVGMHLWAYDVDNGLGAAGTWWRLDPEAGSTGMNVTRNMHHLTMSVALPYIVPVDWPAGHRMVIALRADAHSTAWDRDGNGQIDDHLTVDPYGRLTVRRYTPPAT